jgi:hypothetical protein
MKYKVKLRDDTQGNAVQYRDAEVEFEGTVQELLTHAHIEEVYGVAGDEKKAEEGKEKKEVSKKKKD